MIELDTDALRLVLPALGRGAPITAVQPMQFQDDLLQQVIDVGPLVRRGGAPVPMTGVYTTGLETTHNTGAASTRQGVLDVYNLVPGVSAEPLWPTPEVMKRLDVWLLGVQMETIAGAGNLFGARVLIVFDDNAELDPLGTGASALAGTLGMDVFRANLELTINSRVVLVMDPTSGPPWYQLPRRIPPRSTIVVETRTDDTPNSTYLTTLQLGVFPAGLGQDAL